MLTSRQEKVLEIIIREYVKNVTPVGSKLICDELNCSSAKPLSLANSSPYSHFILLYAVAKFFDSLTLISINFPPLHNANENHQLFAICFDKI